MQTPAPSYAYIGNPFPPHYGSQYVKIPVENLDPCSFRCCCMPVLLVISYRCELDPTTSARVRRCSSLVHSLVPWAGNDVFRQYPLLFVHSPHSSQPNGAVVPLCDFQDAYQSHFTKNNHDPALFVRYRDGTIYCGVSTWWGLDTTAELTEITDWYRSRQTECKQSSNIESYEYSNIQPCHLDHRTGVFSV